MTVLTLNVALPSEFVANAAGSGTSADWLIIQKDGEDYLRRLPAQATVMGGAAKQGSLTEPFSAEDVYLPNGGSIWVSDPGYAATTWGMTFSASGNHITAWAPNLRVRDNLNSDYYATMSCGTLECRASSSGNPLVASISNTGVIEGTSLDVSGAVAGAAATFTSVNVGNTGEVLAGYFTFANDQDSYFYSGGNVITCTVGGTILAQLTTTGLRPFQSETRYLGDDTHLWKEVWALDGTINTSDERTKADIAASDLGLDFIAALRPVSYRWREKHLETVLDPDTQEEVQVKGPGVRRHYGLLAQQVEEALQGRDFAGYIHAKEADVYALRYHEFIAPLITAVQEEQAARLALEVRIATLEARLESLEWPKAGKPGRA